MFEEIEKILTTVIKEIQEKHCLQCQHGNAIMKIDRVRQAIADLEVGLFPTETDKAPEVTLEQFPKEGKISKFHPPFVVPSTGGLPEKAEDLTISATPLLDQGKKEKVCNKCHINKPIDDFEKNKGCRDGHIGQCKKCRGKRTTDIHDENLLREKMNKVTSLVGNVPTVTDTDRPHKCGKCGAGFRTLGSLLIHQGNNCPKRFE
jgi:hypothetical protein